jgi:hypothetical protein
MKPKCKACHKCLCRDCVLNRPDKCPEGCAHCTTPEDQAMVSCDDKMK